jgi:putative redox protein
MAGACKATVQRKVGAMTAVEVTWVQGDQFVASGDGGHCVVIDAPAGRDTWQGMRPTELLLAAVAGCTAVDVIDILRKMRQDVTGLRVSAQGQQHEQHPRAFERIDLHYEVRGYGIGNAAVERAIELSHAQYCSVAATVSGVAQVHTSYWIEEESRCRGRQAEPAQSEDAG